jgi:hypothetical protein
VNCVKSVEKMPEVVELLDDDEDEVVVLDDDDDDVVFLSDTPR